MKENKSPGEPSHQLGREEDPILESCIVKDRGPIWSAVNLATVDYALTRGADRVLFTPISPAKRVSQVEEANLGLLKSKGYRAKRLQHADLKLYLSSEQQADFMGRLVYLVTRAQR